MTMADLKGKIGWLCRLEHNGRTFRIVGLVDVPLNPRPIVYLTPPWTTRIPWQMCPPEAIIQVWKDPAWPKDSN